MRNSKPERSCLSNQRVPAIAIKRVLEARLDPKRGRRDPRARRATFLLLPARLVPAAGFSDHAVGLFQRRRFPSSAKIYFVSWRRDAAGGAAPCGGHAR